MKNYYLFLSILFGISQVSFGQNNPPVAAGDTFSFRYDEAEDTLYLPLLKSFLNSSDSDGDLTYLDTVFYSGAAWIAQSPIGKDSLFGVNYLAAQGFWGTDTLQLVVRDNGTPSLTDTALIFIHIGYPTFAELDGNNIKVRIDKDALFSNLAGHPGFEAPAGSGIHSIYAANLWVAGQSNGSVYANIRAFGDSSQFKDYRSNCGPINSQTYQIEGYDTKWDRVWKVKAYEIEYHLANWNSANYNPPPSFLEWPAHGDTTIGEAYYLAPFYDYDNDGHYNPYNGDYPEIKGDQAIYFIYNDGFSNYSISPMITEVHGMAYAFQCQDSALQNTIFVDYRVINRSQNTFDSTYFGMWTDTDIGNPMDDYVQCDVDRGLYFSYNGDTIDDFHSGKPGYGEYIPVQGIMTLQGAKMDNDGMDNAFGIGTNQTVNGNGYGDGISANEYWGMEYFYYLNNGAMSVGEVGRYYQISGKLPDGTKAPTRFMFPGSSDTYFYGTGGVPSSPWTEIMVGNVPYDRRGVSSSGPVTFAPGDEIELTYAFVFGLDYTMPGNLPSIDVMLERADSIRSYFNQGALGACGFPLSTGNSIEKEKEILIYPNPATDVITIEMGNTEPATIEILDITGKVVLIRNNQAQRATIDINNLPNGVYLVRVRSASQMEVQKIIKQ